MLAREFPTQLVQCTRTQTSERVPVGHREVEVARQDTIGPGRRL